MWCLIPCVVLVCCQLQANCELNFAMSAFGSPSGSVSNSSPSNVGASPNDHNIGPSAGSDGISSLVWSPVSNLLVSTNWDGGVRCWEVQEQAGQIRSIPKAQGKTVS